MHAVVLLPGNVFKCLFFVYFEWMFLLNKHQSWRDSQIQTDPKMSIFRLAGICTVSLPKHRTAVGRDGAPNSLPPISELFFVPLQIKGLCDYQKNHVTLKMMHNVQKL